jgi:hypothetical protein
VFRRRNEEKTMSKIEHDEIEFVDVSYDCLTCKKTVSFRVFKECCSCKAYRREKEALEKEEDARRTVKT